MLTVSALLRPTLIDLSKPVPRKRAAPEAESRPSSSGTFKRLKDQDAKPSQSPAPAESIESEEEDEIQELTENGEYDFTSAFRQFARSVSSNLHAM